MCTFTLFVSPRAHLNLYLGPPTRLKPVKHRDVVVVVWLEKDGWRNCDVMV